ncbi:MAG: MarR family transcriptional regulator [Chloroflexi bacterium]|nr:MarR family transcriptional regulator [Chloroflexota bacterium]
MSPTKEFSDVLREWSEVFMHRSVHDFKRFMDESGISMSHIHILMRLFHGGACGVSDIGDQLGVTNAAASQTVDRLVTMGLLARSEDLSDRRVKQVTLTEQGRNLIQQGIEARCKWMEGLTTALTPEQQETIAAALKDLTTAARKLEGDEISLKTLKRILL